jgi:hypothetical protein
VQVGLALGLKVREKPDILRALDEFGTLTTRLKLMLDPAKRDHAELLTVVEELQPILFAKEPNSKEYAPAREKVIAAARKVIDNEWSKIKRGQ